MNAGPRRSFVRIFNLPEALDERDVRADLRDGVFSLRVAKKRAARARPIPNEVDGETDSRAIDDEDEG